MSMAGHVDLHYLRTIFSQECDRPRRLSLPKNYVAGHVD